MQCESPRWSQCFPERSSLIWQQSRKPKWWRTSHGNWPWKLKSSEWRGWQVLGSTLERTLCYLGHELAWNFRQFQWWILRHFVFRFRLHFRASSQRHLRSLPLRFHHSFKLSNPGFSWVASIARMPMPIWEDGLDWIRELAIRDQSCLSRWWAYRCF